MKTNDAGNGTNRSALITKLALVLAFALGGALVFMGWRGQQVYNASGFSS